MHSSRHGSPHRRAVALVTIASLVMLVACNDDGNDTGNTSPTTEPAASSTTTEPETPRPAASSLRSLDAFAPYNDIALLDGSTPYAGPATPTSLDDVRMHDGFRADLARQPELVAAIEAQGFAIQSERYSALNYFHQRYEISAYDFGTIFVTTDSMYNAWHNAFSKVLRDTETDVLVPALADYLTRTVAAARVQSEQLSGTDLADSAERVVAFYEAAATLLGLDIGAISERANDEVALATDASKATASPITGYVECQLPNAFTGCVDYTQFRPRGHYTSSATLERYFRSMSELGQQAFYVTDTDSLRLGLLAARVATSDPDTAAIWQQIYDTTAFLVGVADDYTPAEAQTAAATVVATGLADAAAFTADAAVSDIGDELLRMRSVGIDPENASVRLMGARLVLDSYVFDQLTWPNVGTDESRRVSPSPLDLASVFGSSLATQIQTDSGETDFAHYPEQLDAMQTLVGSRTGDEWAGTVYDAWLHALEPQFVDRTAAYPDFMQTAAWAAKSLQTGFGSYTELKHDTLLYAKQGSAGEGEGPQPPPYTPRHFVEPDPVAFGRLAALANLIIDGLDARGLLTEANASLLTSYAALATWLAGIATTELAGEPTSDADNTRLSYFGSTLELLWYQSSGLVRAAEQVPDYSDSAALVSDVFRSSEFTLELADGLPETILVIVPDGAGHFQLAVGAVYSYYEFWRPVASPRLTDEEWRQIVTDGTRPQRPAWLEGVAISAEIANGPRVEF
ncbi:MAG: DUF3160 domain-containing protein [Actinomycetota bacterium]|nr:DUF3160 domain-containing protein [Actinomycetota bacterium]